MNWLLNSPLPLAMTAVLYGCMAVAYARVGDKGMCIAFIAYAIANAGFMVAWYDK